MAQQFFTVFPELLQTPDAARAPFAQALREALGSAGEPSLLIFTPEYATYSTKLPASVLAITPGGWLVIEESPSGGTVTLGAPFAHTLWIELTGILLYGRLEIAYVQGAAARRASVVFNTAASDYYSEAAERVLRGMRGLTGSAGRHKMEPVADETGLPFKFRSAVHHLAPPGEQVQSLFSWPMVATEPGASIRRELAAAGMLAVTDQTLLFVREEVSQAILWASQSPHYGDIATFVPLQRLRGYSLSNLDDVSLLRISLSVAAQDDTEDAISIEVPLSRKADAQAFLAVVATAAQAAGGKPWRVSDTRSEPA